jgi:hypothetical protein
MTDEERLLLIKKSFFVRCCMMDFNSATKEIKEQKTSEELYVGFTNNTVIVTAL